MDIIQIMNEGCKMLFLMLAVNVGGNDGRKIKNR